MMCDFQLHNQPHNTAALQPQTPSIKLPGGNQANGSFSFISPKRLSRFVYKYSN